MDLELLAPSPQADVVFYLMFSVAVNAFSALRCLRRTARVSNEQYKAGTKSKVMEVKQAKPIMERTLGQP